MLNIDYTTPSSCMAAGYALVPIPKMLANVRIPDGGDIAHFRSEAALAKGRVFVATGGGHVYMLDTAVEINLAECLACCKETTSQCLAGCFPEPSSIVVAHRQGYAGRKVRIARLRAGKAGNAFFSESTTMTKRNAAITAFVTIAIPVRPRAIARHLFANSGVRGHHDDADKGQRAKGRPYQRPGVGYRWPKRSQRSHLRNTLARVLLSAFAQRAHSRDDRRSDGQAIHWRLLDRQGWRGDAGQGVR